jgi:hypothetical protein
MLDAGLPDFDGSVFIYALLIGDEFRYVGSTKRPRVRIVQLRNNGNLKLRQLIADGALVEMVILRSGLAESDRLSGEQAEVDRLRAEGHRLVNHNEPGNESPKTTLAKRGTPLPDSLRERLTIVVNAVGEEIVARSCGCSRQALARALARLPVYAGTKALIERYLEKE